MSKINYIYRIIRDQPNGKREEFYTTSKEAEFYRALQLDCGYTVSEVECLILWNNVMADEPVTA
jgi:hypothetical protein